MKTTLVMVTYNRLALLKKTLDAHLNMSVRFDDIVVVDNASTDGTYEYLEERRTELPALHVLHSPVNEGGAGGFAVGMAYAMEHLQNDWIFIADDDAVPDKEMLAALYAEYEKIPDREKTAALCTGVINYGTYDHWHRKIVKRGLLTLRYAKTGHLYAAPFPVDEATFVGLMVKTEAARKTGLPDKNFFIYYDDTDYSYRLREHGQILCVPAAKIYHNTRPSHTETVDWRGYYGIRNHLVVVKKYYPRRYLTVLAWLKYLKRASLLSIFLIKADKAGRKMAKTAIREGKRGILGKSETYRPQ